MYLPFFNVYFILIFLVLKKIIYKKLKKNKIKKYLILIERENKESLFSETLNI